MSHNKIAETFKSTARIRIRAAGIEFDERLLDILSEAVAAAVAEHVNEKHKETKNIATRHLV